MKKKQKNKIGKNKLAKFKKLKASRIKKKVKKAPKKAKIKAKIKTVKPVKILKTNAKKTLNDARTERLINKGKERGFITYDEILKEFPTVEDDISFLDALYEKFAIASIDVLEGGGLLEDPSLVKDEYKSDASYDSIQMYLKEIGQHSLISGGQEKD